jgi:hypothetical protein
LADACRESSVGAEKTHIARIWVEARRSAGQQFEDQLPGGSDSACPRSECVPYVTGEYDGHGDCVHRSGEVPRQVEGKQFDEWPGFVVTAAADFLENPGDGVAHVGWVSVFICWTWRWSVFGTGGEISLAGEAEDRLDRIAGVDLSGQRKGERANDICDVPVVAD